MISRLESVVVYNTTTMSPANDNSLDLLGEPVLPVAILYAIGGQLWTLCKRCPSRKLLRQHATFDHARYLLLCCISCGGRLGVE